MIKWNEYTWYSKWFSLIFFILFLPILTFYIGVQYEKANQANDISNFNIISEQRSLALSTKQNSKEQDTKGLIIDTLKEIGIDYPIEYFSTQATNKFIIKNAYDGTYYSARLASPVNEDITTKNDENFIITEYKTGSEIIKNFIIDFNPTDKIVDTLMEKGFSADHNYSGDGGLNGSRGYRKNSIICVVGQFLAPSDPGHDYNYYELSCFEEKKNSLIYE